MLNVGKPSESWTPFHKICYRNFQNQLAQWHTCVVVSVSGQYFKNIIDDYVYVFKEIGSDIKTYPIRSTVYTSSLLGFVYLWKTNPGESMFKEQLANNNNTLLLIGQPIRNPFADKFMTTVNDCYNNGTLKYLNLGVCSVMWVDNYGKEADLYLARCPPLKVGWLDMKDRIVDVGILNKWWFIETAMENWDINPQEWGEKDERVQMPGIRNAPWINFREKKTYTDVQICIYLVFNFQSCTWDHTQNSALYNIPHSSKEIQHTIIEKT